MNSEKQYEAPNSKPSIIFQEVENFASSSTFKPHETRKTIKKSLMAEFDQILEQIEDFPTASILEGPKNNDESKDEIIDKIEEIQKKSKVQNCPQIQRLCTLAIGKRILNIQQKKKDEETIKKQAKKSQIQDFFRENRIKKFDYLSLMRTKLSENSFIVKPYPNGKGFMSTADAYSGYEQALKQCQYEKVIRQVNSRYFDIFEGKHKENHQKLANILLKCLVLSIVAFVAMILAFPILDVSSQIKECLLFGILLLVIALLIILGLLNFFDKPSKNSQIGECISEIKQYFDRLNQQNRSKNRRFRWIYEKSLMFLQIKFHDPI